MMIIESMNAYVRNMIMKVKKVSVFQKHVKVVEFYNNATSRGVARGGA